MSKDDAFCFRCLARAGSSSRDVRLIAIALLIVAVVHPALAQESEPPEAAAARAKAQSIQWTRGPATGRLGSVAQLEVPATCRITDAAGAKTFLEITENIPGGDEVGALYCEDRSNPEAHWFVIYTYDRSGYVKDDEKGKLDTDAILASIQRGTEAANVERQKRGWDQMSIEGWVRPPYYDERTHNLTWSFTGRSGHGDASVNHSVRLLGRGGVLHADLVLDPEQLGTVVSDFDAVMTGTSFLPGSRYAEWREGDKVAAYGLTALVAGGAGAVAMKTGLLAKLWKLAAALVLALWKLLVVAALGLVAMVKSIFTRKSKDRSVPTASSSP